MLALATMVTFLLVLAALVLTSPGRIETAGPEATDVPHRMSGPRTSPCIACPLGHTCGDTGQCVLIERTPVECVKGATYDEDEDFCVPDPTPEPPSPRRAPARGSGGTPARPTPSGTPDLSPPPTDPTPEPTPPPATPAATPAQ